MLNISLNYTMINTTNTTKINILVYNTILLPLICLMGITLNIICFLAILRPSFREKYKFRYIIVKLALDLFVCFTGAGFFDPDCILLCLVKNDLFSIGYSFYIKLYLTLIIYLISGFNEILLTHDRNLILRNKTDFSNKKGHFKYVLIIEIILSLVITLHFWFAYTIKSNQDRPNQYFISFTDFGRTQFFKYYEISVITVTNSVSILILMLVSFKTIKAYKVFISRRSVTQQNLAAEKRFTQMVGALSGLFLVVRIFYLLRGIIRTISLLTGMLIAEAQQIDIFVQLALYINCSSNFFILFFFNTTFRKKCFFFKY